MEQELRERIEKFNVESEDLKHDMMSYVVDTSVDLDIRWKLFAESKLGDTPSSYIDFSDLGVDAYGDDLVYERRKYETVDLIGLIHQMEENIENWKGKQASEINEHERLQFEKTTPDLIIKMKERILENFTKACIFNW